MSEDRMKRFDEIKLAALNCTACPLAATRTQVVFSRGDPRARLWIIGEGPGSDEDATGTPFVGRAGQLLDKILVAAKIGQNEVFITNTVFCRPPGNRVPTNEEITACSVHRDALLDLWKPPIVVLLGATAARVFLGADRLADLRGQRVERDGRAYFPTFHPAYLLRDPRQKGPAWKDWQLIRDALRGLPPDGGGAHYAQDGFFFVLAPGISVAIGPCGDALEPEPRNRADLFGLDRSHAMQLREPFRSYLNDITGELRQLFLDASGELPEEAAHDETSRIGRATSQTRPSLRSAWTKLRSPLGSGWCSRALLQR